MATLFKISDMTELTAPADADFFEIIDDSEVTPSDKNKKLTWSNIKLQLATKAAIDSDHTAWSSGTTYTGNVTYFVSHESRLYEFIKATDSTNEEPGTDAAVWTPLDAADLMYPAATDAETTTGTATNRYLTPANLASQNFLTTSDNLYTADGTLDADRTATLSTYDLKFNVSSTGEFIIQDGGTEKFAFAADGQVHILDSARGGSGVLNVGSSGSTGIYVLSASGSPAVRLNMYVDSSDNAFINTNNTGVAIHHTLNNTAASHMFSVGVNGRAAFCDSSANANINTYRLFSEATAGSDRGIFARAISTVGSPYGG